MPCSNLLSKPTTHGLLWQEYKLINSYFIIIFVVAFSVFVASGPVWAQSTDGATSEISVERLEALISELEADDKTADSESQVRIIDIYKTALDRLKAADEETETAAQFKNIAETGSEQLEDLQSQIDRLQTSDTTVVEAAGSTRELESQLIAEQSALLELRNRLSKSKDKLGELTNRPRMARQEATDARKMLEELHRSLDSVAVDGQDQIEQVKRILLETRKRFRTAQVNRLEQELLSHDLQTQLVQNNIELLDRKVDFATKKAVALNNSLQAKRKSEAEQATQEAARVEQELSDKHPVLQQIAEQNAQYSKELAALVTQQSDIARDLEIIRARAEQISADAILAQTRLENAQVSEALGQVLREQRRRLPETKAYRRDAKERQDAIANIAAGQFQVEQQLNLLDDVNDAATGMMDVEVSPDTTVIDRAQIESGLRDLLSVQKETLDKLSKTYTENLRGLADLDFEHKLLVDEAASYAALLDERLLWIPSAPALGMATLTDLPNAFAWQLSPVNWKTLALSMISDARNEPVINLLALILFGAIMRYRIVFRNSLVQLAKEVKKIYSDKFSHTICAFGMTLLLALPLPILTGFISWRLLGDHTADVFVKSVGSALALIAINLFLLRFLYHLCRPQGVAQTHFHWRESTLRLLRFNLPWFTVVFSIATLVAILDWHRLHTDLHSLTRLAFILVTLALAVFSKRVFEPASGIFAAVITRNPNGWLSRLRVIWYPAIVCIPLILAILAGFGYLDTAAELQRRVIGTVWLIVAAVIIHNLIERWLIVAQRRLAIKKAKERREAARSEEAKGIESSAEGDRVLLDTSEMDISTINLQTRHLMKTILGWSVVIGTWRIWAGVLPALGVLDNLTLWQHDTVVEGEVVSSAITLTTLLWAFVVGAIVAAAARNLPGVLEILILQRLPFNFGSRYAITKLSQYIIIAIGIVIIFGTIGVNWAEVQWLVAALGVGLGFGLQEIFANFMSGLIILFERPVRIGDTVTIGDLSGTVSRMRMRATTITDWDNKEIIVPNKMFITERLINWTLSDPITRVMIPIGIAYGSDTNLAYRLIRETAEQNPLVLQEPQIQVFFLGFGDSSLNFELRVFVRDLADRLKVQHELHMVLNRIFAENDIEVPFPQRDLHVRSWVEPQGHGLDQPNPSTA